MNKRRKLSRKLILLNILVIVILCATLIALFVVRKNYRIQTLQFHESGTLKNVTLTCTDDNVIQLDGFSITEDREIVFDISAKGTGQTEAVFSYEVEHPGGEIRNSQYTGSFEVNFLGQLRETTNYHLNFPGYLYAIWALLAILMLIEVFAIWDFIEKWRRGNFSYSMVANGSIALFFFVLFAFGLYKYLNNVIRSFGDFQSILSDIGYQTLVLLSPIMLVIAAFLAFSNIWLMRHEGYRPVNTLGIIFGAFWFLGMLLVMGQLLFNIDLGLPEVVRRILMYLMCYSECLFLSTMLSAVLASWYKPSYDKDYIIILGCAIRKDGTLTPLLRGRVDAALAFEKAQYDATGRHATFVPSGGQGGDEPTSEGEAMSRYLQEQGISTEQILVDGKSVNTYQNMSFSKKVIEDAIGDIQQKHIAFSTTNYHIFRGYVLSEKCGFHAEGIKAKTKLYFYPNAFLREFIGLIVDRWKRHLVYIVLTVIFFLVV